jgi:hypothetical protein
MKNIF